MPRIFTGVILFLLCASSAVSQAPISNPRLMSDADYKVFLSRIETALPKWEAAYKSIDLEKAPQLSYSTGKSIADLQTVGLTEIDNIRTFIYFQRHKRSVQGELALMMFLNTLFDEGEEIVFREVMSGLTLSTLDKHGLEISTFSKDLFIDIQARVQLLEKGTCP